jgi:hypothetical protein
MDAIQKWMNDNQMDQKRWMHEHKKSIENHNDESK